jgi:hypothetical protein
MGLSATTVFGAITGVPGTGVGARDEDELANGRRTAMELEKGPDLNEEGDAGDVESPSWVEDDIRRRAGSIVS